MPIKLTPRLKCIADYIDNGSIVADIGTDHAYLPIYLVENGICSEIYASDISEGPLNRAQYYMRRHIPDKMKNITLIQSNGFENIPNRCNCIVIAGMGGDTISQILHDGSVGENKKLILQPMKESVSLRKFLYDNNFTIIDESIVEEKQNRLYSIIVAKYGHEQYRDLDLYMSKPLQRKHDNYARLYLEKLIRVQRKIIDGKRNSRFIKQDAVKRELNLYKELQEFERLHYGTSQ